MNHPWDLPTKEQHTRYETRRERRSAIELGLADVPLKFFTVTEFASLLRFMTYSDKFHVFEDADFELLERKIGEFKSKSLADRLRSIFCRYCGANIKDDSDHRC